MRMREAAIGTLIILPVRALAQSGTPQRPPTFEVGIEVIRLNVSVTDGHNRHITDLAEKDFAVYEDGVRQDLSLFTHENLPFSVSLLVDTSASMDEKLSVAQDGRRPLRQDPAARGPRPDRPVQRPGHGPAGLHRGPAGPRGGDPEHAGVGAHRALQRPLHRPEGPAEAREGRRAAATRDRAALRRRGHGLPGRTTTRCSSWPGRPTWAST